MKVTYTCPRCGVQHDVEVCEEEYYDGLCMPCEEAWVDSTEYAMTLAMMSAALWVQCSAEYPANAISISRAAADRLDAALAQAGWDALVPAERELAK